MALSGTRLNTQRYSTVLSDIQAQFPVPTGLLAAEQTAFAANQQKIAHSVADHEGSDVVTEITTNALVPLGIAVNIPSTAAAGSPSTGNTSANGTVQ